MLAAIWATAIIRDTNVIGKMGTDRIASFGGTIQCIQRACIGIVANRWTIAVANFIELDSSVAAFRITIDVIANITPRGTAPIGLE